MDPAIFTALGKGLIALVKATEANEKSQNEGRLASVHTDETALIAHLNFVNNWSARISMGYGTKQLALKDTFIRLRLEEGRRRVSPARSGQSYVDPQHLLNPGHHSIILGEPGAGKTTLVKSLCQALFTSEPDRIEDTLNFPVLVILRLMDRESSLAEAILATTGITVAPIGQSPEASRYANRFRMQLLSEICDKEGVLVLLDGLDELELPRRQQMCAEISSINQLLNNSTVIATCRFGALPSHVEGANVFSIDRFDDQDKKTFAECWFRHDDTSQAFLTALEGKSYVDTMRTPLHLANLCLLYERQKRLPPSAIRVVEKIINLRLEEWDRERGINRGSLYREFGPDEKRRFLAALSFELTSAKNIGAFTERELLTAYDHVIARSTGQFDLTGAQAPEVVREIESHSGLIVQVDDDTFEFYHLTLFEYLCADYISRSRLELVQFSAMAKVPEAVAVAASLVSSSDDYLLALALKAVENKDTVYATLGSDFWRRVITRLDSDAIELANNEKIGCAFLLAVDSMTNHSEGKYNEELEKERRAFVSLLRSSVSSRKLDSVIQKALYYYPQIDHKGSDCVLSAKSQKLCGSVALPLQLNVPAVMLNITGRDGS